MIRNEQHDVVAPASGGLASKPVGLSDFDGQSMAIVLNRKNGRIVMRGRAVFVRDDAIGNTLNIRLANSEPGEPVLVIAENEWDGRIIPDFHHGCDFCLIMG